MQKNMRGFTLLEAIVALMVTVILLAVAVPAWSNAVAAVHAGNARSVMATTLIDSMRHATIGGAEVVVCPSLDAVACTGAPDWTPGWIAFADIDRNRVRGAHEPILRREPALEGGVRLNSTRGRTRLVFQPGGSNAGSNVTFTLCDSRGPEKAITLVLANGGRMRAGKPTAAAAMACVQG